MALNHAVGRTFVEKSCRLLDEDYLVKIERCLAALDARDIWWRPNEASNSVGNLILHLCGNVTMWILGGVGQRTVVRNRQAEFDEKGPIATNELRGRLRTVVAEAVKVIDSLNDDDLLALRQIQGYDVTVLEAIYHVVEHFGMHTGQIIVLSKARGGRDLELWRPPSGAKV